MMVAYELARIRFFEYEPDNAPYAMLPPPKQWPLKREPKEIRTVSVVMLGSFRLEEVTMPSVVAHTNGILLPSRRIAPVQPPPQGDGSPSQGAQHMARPRPYSWDVARQLRRAPLPEWGTEREPGPALEIKFLSYILYNTWRLRFAMGDVEAGDDDFHKFIAGGEVFSGDLVRQSYGFEFFRHLDEFGDD